MPPQGTSAAAYVFEPPPEDDPLLDFAPYVHKAPRRNSITPDVQRAFVSELASTGIVRQAARRVGRSLEALYKLRERPGAEGFAAAWDEALAWGADRLEDCALERALRERWSHDGWEGRGDALLMFLIGRRGTWRVDERELRPGHPVYERIRAEVLAEMRAKDRAEDRGDAAQAPGADGQGPGRTGARPPTRPQGRRC